MTDDRLDRYAAALTRLGVPHFEVALREHPDCVPCVSIRRDATSVLVTARPIRAGHAVDIYYYPDGEIRLDTDVAWCRCSALCPDPLRAAAVVHVMATTVRDVASPERAATIIEALLAVLEVEERAAELQEEDAS